ncbi:MAG: 30S ribosomal protein S9 [bacterium]|nr:30S ribosomal protein S9 [bacterium]
MAEKTPTPTKSPIKKNSLTATAVGRRKTAVARVRLTFKKGPWLVNQKPIDKYFPSVLFSSLYATPLKLAKVANRVGFEAKVQGGGLMAQIDAINHALARALVKYDQEAFKKLMRQKGFLTRDPRKKERRKPGRGGKARRKRQSPKR